MDIVRELLGVGDDVTFAILAERFDVSERTIRNDIASINNFLEGSGLGLINYGPGGSIVLPDDFVELRDRLPEGGSLRIGSRATSGGCLRACSSQMPRATSPSPRWRAAWARVA